MSPVEPTRAYGHLVGPTAAQVAQYVARQHFHVADEDLQKIAQSIGASLSLYDRLDAMDEPCVELKYPFRDPGRRPRAGEDPYNAFIRFCEVRGAESGPLSGKRVGIKDCIAVAGVPMTNGGRRVPYAVPTEDAVVVERLLDAGATIVGKLNMEDMAAGLGEASFFGAALNPVNPRYSTGGSSSGSGAAVAAGLVDMALGADEAGSVRIPAAWCGIVGMKATHGLVPSYGMSYMDHTIDHIGPMTRGLRDNALMLGVIAGGDWRDPQWVRCEPSAADYLSDLGQPIRGLRIGVVTEALEPIGCTPDVLAAFDSARGMLASAGADLTPVSIPLWSDAWAIEAGCLAFGLHAMFQSFGQGYGHLGRIDVGLTAATVAQMRMQADYLPPFLKSMLLTAEHLREAYAGVHFGKAQNLRLELRRQVEMALRDVDVLITPTTPTVAFELLDRRADADEMMMRAGNSMSAILNTCPLDLSGHPALTVPCGTGDHDLPVGLQIIGPRFGEARLYQVGAAVMDVESA